MVVQGTRFATEMVVVRNQTPVNLTKIVLVLEFAKTACAAMGVGTTLIVLVHSFATRAYRPALKSHLATVMRVVLMVDCA